MIAEGVSSLQKIAVIGRGTAGSLAAASVSKLHPNPDHTLHHIYDSKIPVIGVGEGGWPTLVTQLHELTGLPYDTIQKRLRGTRKYGIQYEGWGCLNQDFTHYFSPQQLRYSYHLSADFVTEILQQATRAEHIDLKVQSVSKMDDKAVIEFIDGSSETYDLVLDARGFPKELDLEEHILIDYIPTNTAIIRRCPPIVKEEGDQPYIHPTYTRAVARPHGWVFVIPLVAHTSYGYIFNRDVSDISDVESDFDQLLDSDQVKEFEQRAVIPFPNFVHRHMYEGPIARVGNAGAFMEPLEATAIVSAQLQIGLALHMRFNRDNKFLFTDAPMVNKFLINTMMGYGLFVGWHYSCGSKYTTDFWRHAREKVWPRHRNLARPNVTGSGAFKKFDQMFDLLKQPVLTKEDWEKKCGVPVSSYAQTSQGLGCYPPSP